MIPKMESSAVFVLSQSGQKRQHGMYGCECGVGQRVFGEESRIVCIALRHLTGIIQIGRQKPANGVNGAMPRLRKLQTGQTQDF